MNKKLIAAVVTGLALTVVTGTAMAGTASPWVNQRERNQAHRLYNGIVNGDVNFHEAGKLIRGQVHVRRMEHRFKSDGNLTLGERLRLQNALDRQSARIHWDKHN
ncbi:MAG: hypothetical protein WBP94_05570 [Rhodomicrobiaceae bacterium]